MAGFLLKCIRLIEISNRFFLYSIVVDTIFAIFSFQEIFTLKALDADYRFYFIIRHLIERFDEATEVVISVNKQNSVAAEKMSTDSDFVSDFINSVAVVTE